MNRFLKTLPFIAICLLSAQLNAMNGVQQNPTVQIDAQFAREQASKQQSAQANADAESKALMQELQREEALSTLVQQKDADLLAQDEEDAKNIRAWLATQGCDKSGNALEKLSTLPLPLLHAIVEFHYGDPVKLKFIANTMDKLIPAVVRWNHHVFDRIADAKMFLRNCKTIIFTDGDRHISSEIKSPALYADFKTKPNSFVGYQLPSKKIIFKVCPSKFKLLENLSLEQLQFLASLYDLYMGAKENVGFALDQLDPAVRIELEEDQQKMFFTLPLEIQDVLEANYGNDDPAAMPYVMIVHKALVI